MDENSIAYKALTDKYPTGAVLAAAEITNTALQNWFHRKLVIGHKGDRTDMKEPFTGRRLFSFENVMAFAIVKQLTGLGVDIQNAFKAANQFSFVAGDRHGCRRLPSFPFVGGDDTSLFDVDTLLAAHSERSLLIPHQKGDGTLDGFLGHFPDGFTLLKINPVFERVAAKLGYHPLELMESAYRGKKFTGARWAE